MTLFSLLSRRLSLGLPLGLLLGLVGCSEPPVGFLRVCLGEADPPRSVEGKGGFDVDMARLLADALNRNLRIEWQPEPRRTEIESTDLSFAPLLSGQCDLMLSIPGADAIAGSTGQLALSEPYYGTGFELIPEDGELKSGHTIAVRANTVAHVVVDGLGYDWTMQPDTPAIALAVVENRADAGLVWGPELALIDVKRNRAYSAPALLRWNQHLVVRRQDAALLSQLNVALAQHSSDVLGLLTTHGLPAHKPFDAVHQPQELRAL